MDSTPVRSPNRILLIKGHSSGIGDLLCGSAAWRALATHFPGAELHLLLLTRDPNYVSHAWIARHHLLRRSCVLDKRARGLSGWRQFLAVAIAFAQAVPPQMIVDFEPNGIRTSILAFWLGRKFRSHTLGIAQHPIRRFFYGQSSVSFSEFARQRNLPEPLNYADRDFVVLSALGIERRNIPIELEEPPEAINFRQNRISGQRRFLGLNIGCGTLDALHKRPDLELLSLLVDQLQRRYGLDLLLMGAPFEVEVHRSFQQMQHR